MRKAHQLEHVLASVRHVYKRIGEPTGEILLAYHDGQLSDKDQEDVGLILSLRPDLRLEMEVRVEMRQEAGKKLEVYP